MTLVQHDIELVQTVKMENTEKISLFFFVKKRCYCDRVNGATKV